MRRHSLRSAPLPATVGLIVGGCCAGVVLTAAVMRHGPVRRLDWAIHHGVDTHLAAAVPRATMTLLTLAGARGLVAVPLLLVALLAARRHHTGRPLVVAAGALVATAAAVWLVKMGVGRLAPAGGHDRFRAGGLSYPSGHAANAVVCWGLLLEYAASLGPGPAAALPVVRRRVVTAVVAGAAGLGMVALDYHWLSDVVAGWLLGALLLGVVLAVGPVRRPVSRPSRTGRAAAPAPARRAPSG